MEASQRIDFSGTERAGVCQRVEETLPRYHYSRQSREARGVLREFLARMTGLSVPQVARLIGRCLDSGQVRQKQYQRHHFPRCYGKDDMVVLASLDEAPGVLSGPATKRILQREQEVYGKPQFERLANIPVSHLYNLRHTTTWQPGCLVMGKTTPATVAIAERRRPDPQGRPGYLRIDTVHQPEQDGANSVRHINAVDEVTQREVLGCVPKISEHYLAPMREAMLGQFPFPILGCHADNGSEHINARVAALLEKLRVEFTKSRPRHSNDNGLVETKNGAVVRKHMRHPWLPPSHADDIDAFCRQWFTRI